jgi:uncharacterized protein (DUF849 family)
MLIQAALNGGRSRAEHPAIPITPEQLAASARECAAAGAGAVHFHVRDAAGKETIAPAAVAAAVSAVRRAAPGTPCGVSIGLWIVSDPAQRHATVAAWTTLPDFTTVNFREAGALALARDCLDRGLGLEVGVTEMKGAQAFIDSGLAPRCLRILMEPMEQDLAAARAATSAMIAAFDGAGITLPRMLHGLNATAWPIIDDAQRHGYDTRVGFEDVLTLRDGRPARSNGELVAEVRR